MADKTGVINDLAIKGKINICKTNANGDITWEEDVHNDIIDGTRNVLAGALINKDYSWSAAANRLAFYGSTYTANSSLPCQDLGGGTGAYSPDKTAIIVETETDNDLVLLWDSTNTGATVSGNSITISASLTGEQTATYDGAKLGILDTFFASGSGSLIWRYHWATGSFAAVTVTSADTLTVTWTFTVG